MSGTAGEGAFRRASSKLSHCTGQRIVIQFLLCYC